MERLDSSEMLNNLLENKMGILVTQYTECGGG